ncbi:hypothetical protein AGMMS50212_06830 [Spirochaetia bacterium]|nr:hypothetical protein AGMMS50212_06830 [Spirochaetia bacterium]
MYGNVLEWCWDWYGGYRMAEQTDPAGAASGSSCVYRGGSWYRGASYLRAAKRNGDDPNIWDSNIGFRLVRP